VNVINDFDQIDFSSYDADGDGIDEFFLFSHGNSSIIVLDSDGSELGSLDLENSLNPLPVLRWEAGIADDVNNDGQIEIITGALFNTSFSARNLLSAPLEQGSELETIATAYQHLFFPLPALDYDGDGAREFLIAFRDSTLGNTQIGGGILAFPTDSAVQKWVITPPGPAKSIVLSAAIGDLDQDNRPEVCYYFSNFQNSGLTCTSMHGQFQAWVDNQLPSVEFSIGDVNDDGLKEIIAFNRKTSGLAEVVSLSARDGKLLWISEDVFSRRSLFAFSDTNIWILNPTINSSLTKMDGLTGSVFEKYPDVGYIGIGAANDEIYFSRRDSVGIIDQGTGAVREVLYQSDNNATIERFGVSQNGDFFFIQERPSGGGAPTGIVLSSSGQPIYSFKTNIENFYLDNFGRVVVTNTLGAEMYSSDAIDILFASEFDTIF